MRVVRISEKELMERVSIWESFAEMWGDRPEDLILRIELWEDRILIKDDTYPEYRYTLEEISSEEESYQELIKIFQGC